MRTFLRNLLTDLRNVWADPQADPQQTVVFIAAGAILLLLLFVVMLMVISWGPKRAAADGVRRRRRNRVSRALVIPGMVLVLLGAWLAADEFATAPTTCGRCHEIAPSVITHSQSDHAETDDCMSCHDQGGVMGYVATRVRGLSNLAGHYLSGRSTLEADVIDSNCLRCHADIETGTAEFRSIRVRHEDFLGRGASCLRCHGATGHAVTGAFVERPTMDKCVACHDNQTASAACEICHLSDVAEARDIPDNYPKAHLAEKRTCEGCHSLEPCRQCHGLEMPHPLTFASPEHAPLAAFSGKDTLCYRCHEPEDCRRCHQSFDAHGPDWVTRHALTPRSPLLECGNCHDQIPTAIICDYCHEP